MTCSEQKVLLKIIAEHNKILCFDCDHYPVGLGSSFEDQKCKFGDFFFVSE